LTVAPRRRYSRSPVDSRRFRDRDEHRYPSRSPRRDGRRSRSPDARQGRREPLRPRLPPRSDESDPDTYRERRGRSRSRSPPDRRIRHGDGNDDADDDGASRKRDRSRSPAVETALHHKRIRPSLPSKPPITANVTEDRAVRLAAMSNNAAEMSTERKDRLNALLEKEKAELEAEERVRTKSKGMGGFLSHEQKKVFGGHGGLEERLRRGRAGLVSQMD